MATSRPRSYINDIDPLNIETTLRLSSAQRVQRLLHARQVVMGLRLGQLRREYPMLSRQELILKMIDSFNDNK